jgi:hypothetical protein
LNHKATKGQKMPNWVTNRITINGSEQAIADFKAKAGKPIPIGIVEGTDEIEYSDESDHNPLSFQNFIAPPLEAIKSGEYFGTRGFVEGNKVGHTSNNWYEFNNREWGTKWDSSDTELEVDQPTQLEYSFATAWSPPEQVLHAMVEQHQDLSFEVWWEEEQGFGAELATEDFEGIRTLVEQRTWDIPSSHSDYVEKDDVDSCYCAWEENPNEWYDDCENVEEERRAYNKEQGGTKEEPNLVY